MASVNKVILVGNCGRDPAIRHLASGQVVASVSLATTSRRRDRTSGEMIEETQWHSLTFYDRLAEIAREYVRKGRSIYVEGRLKYGKYTGQDGMERSSVDIVVTELQLLGGDRLPGSVSASKHANDNQKSSPSATRASEMIQVRKEALPDDDDIPF